MTFSIHLFLYSTGSHDTMTYCLDKKSGVSGNESKLVKLLNKCMPCIVHPIIMKWSTTQVTVVWHSHHPWAKSKPVLQHWECSCPAVHNGGIAWCPEICALMRYHAWGLWFNFGWQLSITQPLSHSLLLGLGKDNRQSKSERTHWLR